MENSWISENTLAQARIAEGADFTVAGTGPLAAFLAAAARGDANAYFDLGVAYSTDSNGIESDLIEAHKWFNLAAVAGHEDAPECRAEVSDEMTAREIAEAQRRAREWLKSTRESASTLRRAA
ncbi:hypothetical protein I5E68_17545 [Novosphingobium sp. YJ-S2-02]|uniref:Sel1 repeat family protein n=1 Tax=Novosphingobium aureum TaxID=2792964 RepID=A0A931HER1_9SPHN|nr:hypothetical protein [Novosphingobium aureum]MBH0114755.1 hypothetical protein [Novosphingobium aureum]